MIDGTNASDPEADRPGMRALKEMEVRSPLRECGLTKDMIRKLSKQAGLFTWNKPAYACLATRIPTGVPIEKEFLEKVERAEAFLTEQGFSNLRVRILHGHARIQLPEEQWDLLLQKAQEIRNRLSEDFQGVLLDLYPREKE